MKKRERLSWANWKQTNRALLEKPRALLTKAERSEIETHVVRGQEILNSIRGIPEDVAQLVYEHHEDMVEQGYPNRTPKKDLHPLSKILMTVNVFVEHALKSPNQPGRTGPEALAHIERMFQGRLDPHTIKALREIYQDQNFKKAG